MLLDKETFKFIKEPKLHAILRAIEEDRTLGQRNVAARRAEAAAARQEDREQRFMRESQSKRFNRKNSVTPDIAIPADCTRVWGADIFNHEADHATHAEWWHMRRNLPAQDPTVERRMRSIEAEWRIEDQEDSWTLEEMEAQGIVEFEELVERFKGLQAKMGIDPEERDFSEDEKDAIIEAFEQEYDCKLDLIADAYYFGVDWRQIIFNAIDGRNIIAPEQHAKLYTEFQAAEMKEEHPCFGKCYSYINWLGSQHEARW